MNEEFEQPVNPLSYADYRDLLSTVPDPKAEYDQFFVIDRMINLGYKVNRDGMCSAMASLSRQSFLVTDVDDDAAEKRLAIFARIPVDNFAGYMERMLLLRNELKTRGDLTKAAQVQSTITDIFAYFDSLMMFYSYERQAHLYENKRESEQYDLQTALPQSYNFASEIIRPRPLQEARRRPATVGIVSASYRDSAELEAFLSGIKHMPERCSVLLDSGSMHAITINFDPKAGYFILDDPSEQPRKKYPIEQLGELAEAVEKSLHFNDEAPRTYIANISTNREHLELLKKSFNQLEAVPSWVAIQAVTPQRLKEIRKVDYGSLFFNACNLGLLDRVGALLEQGVSRGFDNGVPALFNAAMMGRADVVRAILEKRREVPRDSIDGISPLFVAAAKGHRDVVTAILDKRHELPTDIYNNKSPLFIAAENGNADVVRVILKKRSEGAKDFCNGVSPLFIAAENGNADVVKVILEERSESLGDSFKGISPLCIAVIKGHAGVVRAILEKRGYLGYLPEDFYKGRSPLFIAASNGNADVVSVLLEKNGESEADMINSSSPLFAAAYNGHIDVVRVFLEKRGVGAQDFFKGMSPYDTAIKRGHLAVAELLASRVPELEASVAAAASLKQALVALRPPNLELLKERLTDFIRNCGQPGDAAGSKILVAAQKLMDKINKHDVALTTDESQVLTEGTLGEIVNGSDGLARILQVIEDQAIAASKHLT